MIVVATAGLIGAPTTALADPPAVDQAKNALCGAGLAAGVQLLQDALCRLPSTSDVADSISPPQEIPESVINAIPSGHTVFAPTSLLGAQAPRRTAVPAAVPTGYRCELQAYDTRQYYGEVHGNGFNHCTFGVLMKSQVCIYKLHHILFFPQYRREACNPTNLGVADRPPAFRPVSVSRGCRSGRGKWLTLVYGSLEFRPGPGGTDYGATKSKHETTLCN